MTCLLLNSEASSRSSIASQCISCKGIQISDLEVMCVCGWSKCEKAGPLNKRTSRDLSVYLLLFYWQLTLIANWFCLYKWNDIHSDCNLGYTCNYFTKGSQAAKHSAKVKVQVHMLKNQNVHSDLWLFNRCKYYVPLWRLDLSLHFLVHLIAIMFLDHI